MRRRYGRFRKIPKWVQVILFVVLLGTLCAIILYAGIEEKKREEELLRISKEYAAQEAEREALYNITLIDDDDVDLMDGIQAEETVSTVEMIDSADFTSGYRNNAVVRFSVDESKFGNLDEELYMLAFEAYAENSSEALIVKIGNESTTYYVSKEKSAFYLPISSVSNISISLRDDFQNTYIGNIGIYRMKNSDIRCCKYGQYDLSEVDELQLSQVDSTSCKDILISSEYNYVLSKNELRIQTKNDEVVSTIKGLGNTVHMCYVNEQTIAITARENDIYIVDVSNAYDPTIISTYDGMDLETGIDSNGQFIFACSRYYGVEIVDVSDIQNPVTCSVISTGGECIECVYSDQRLYISNWNLKTVYVYDVSNPNNPVELYSIATDGNPYGLEICNGYLYVATGHHSVGNHSAVKSGGYGAGHGFEIYDLSSDRASWVSTTKIDGRLYYAANDSWGIYVNGDYAFLSSTYAGVYVYNISDAANPKRIGEAGIKISNESELYSYSESERYIFPYDPTQYINETFAKIAFDNGLLYLAGQTTGLYKAEFEESAYVVAEKKAILGEYDGSYFTGFKTISSGKIDSTVVTPGYSVNSISKYGDLVILGCGDNGIKICTKTGAEISSLNTLGSVQDVKIVGDCLYVAEGNYGIEVYSIDESGAVGLINTYNCHLVNETVTQFGITADEKYLITQNGWTRLALYDISSLSNQLNAIDNLTTGALYFRNILNSDGKTNAMGFESSREMKIYGSAEIGLYEICSLQNTVYEERNGMCLYDDNLIIITGGGFSVLPLTELEQRSDLSNLSVKQVGEDLKLKGKVIAKDGVMVVSDPYDKTIRVINIEDLNNPYVILSTSTTGSPDVACITKDNIYIPLKYQGYIIIER